MLDRLLCLEVRRGRLLRSGGEPAKPHGSAQTVHVHTHCCLSCQSIALPQAAWHCGSMLPQTVFTSLYMLQPERCVVGRKWAAVSGWGRASKVAALMHASPGMFATPLTSAEMVCAANPRFHPAAGCLPTRRCTPSAWPCAQPARCLWTWHMLAQSPRCVWCGTHWAPLGHPHARPACSVKPHYLVACMHCKQLNTQRPHPQDEAFMRFQVMHKHTSRCTHRMKTCLCTPLASAC